MKILIWAACYFVMAVINAALMANHIMLGAIPAMLLFCGFTWLATRLCKAWERHRDETQK